MTATPPQDEQLTGWQPVAERLQLRERAFWKLLSEGLPHYRINSRVFRFKWSEVEAWLESRRRGE